jgi:hypothetical protein
VEGGRGRGDGLGRDLSAANKEAPTVDKLNISIYLIKNL